MRKNIGQLESELAESVSRLGNLAGNLPNNGYFQHQKVPSKKMSRGAKVLLTTLIMGGILGGCIYKENKESQERRYRNKLEWDRRTEEENKLQAIEDAKRIYVFDARPNWPDVIYTENPNLHTEICRFLPEFLNVNSFDSYIKNKGSLNRTGHNYDQDPVVYTASSKENNYHITQRKYKDSFFRLFSGEEYKRITTWKSNLKQESICLDEKMSQGNYSRDSSWNY